MMAKDPKKRKLMPDLGELEQQRGNNCLKELKNCIDGLKKLELRQILKSAERPTEDQIVLWLIATYGLSSVFKLVSCINVLPISLTSHQKTVYISQSTGIPTEGVNAMLSLIEESCPGILNCFASSVNLPVVIAPPVRECFECGQRLVSNHKCKVRLYQRDGVTIADKVTLRCVKCRLIYNPTQFGNKSDVGFRYYESTGQIVEATDGVCISRSLVELHCSLANHAWVSFQGFSEAYNSSLSLPKNQEMSAEVAAEAFYNGEIELELQRINQSDYRFKLNHSDREACFEKIEELRRVSVYAHSPDACSKDCKERGCGTLWVTDGIWKVNFAHCMYSVKTSVDGFNISLPDVCTSSPVRGKAFCTSHCALLQKEASHIPVGLVEFLKYCKENKGDSESLSEDGVVERMVRKLPSSTVAIDKSTAASQGIDALINKYPQMADETQLAISEALCRKDTGKRKSLRKWSRGHQFVVRGGGHIDTWQPLYLSESPSQVFLILIQWLLSTMDTYGNIGEITLAYDNMCNLQKMKIAQKPLPFSAPYDTLWFKVNKIIDVFHFPNHVDTKCKEQFSPLKFKEEHPNFNTQAGEQLFVWVGKFNRILCAMSKNHHLFFLHRMVIRHNLYTAKCYKYGRKPILPKKGNK